MNKTLWTNLDRPTADWHGICSLPQNGCYKNDYFGAAVDSHRMVIVNKRNIESSKGKSALLYDDRYPNKWSPLPNPPGRSSITSVTGFDGKLFVFNRGYTNEVYFLDVDKKKWNTLPSPNHMRDCCSIVVLGTYLYAFGGFRGLYLGMRKAQNSVERLNTVTMEWENLTAMPTARAFPTAACVGNNIVVAGGVKHDWGEGVNNVEIFDTTTQKWSNAPPLPVESFASAAVSVGQFMIITGGVKSFMPGESLDITQIYDTTSQDWKILPAKMSHGRAWHASALLSTGQLIIAGGGAPAENFRFDYMNLVEAIIFPTRWSKIRPVVMLRWLAQKNEDMIINTKNVDNFDKMMRKFVSPEFPWDLFRKICEYV